MIRMLMLTDFIFSEPEEGKWYKLSWATKHQLLVNTNVTATTTTDWMLQLALTKIAHSISKQGCKFKQE